MDLLPPCPHLPSADPGLSAVSIRAVGEDRGEAFYRLALACGQALWQKGLPAQAILMLNRAFSADLRGDEPGLIEWPPPYAALRWILEHRREEDFVGNPRRHFQHLATRMSGPRPEVRSWRAWACWAIACAVNPEDPADEKQILEEGIVEPDLDSITEALRRLGWSGEVDVWTGAVGS
jgi:hypothetical protein